VRSQGLVNGLLNGPQRFGGKVSIYMVGPRDIDHNGGHNGSVGKYRYKWATTAVAFSSCWEPRAPNT
jgi:hypothetical protein